MPVKPSVLVILVGPGLAGLTIIAAVPAGARSSPDTATGPASLTVERWSDTGLTVKVSLPPPHLVERASAGGTCRELHLDPGPGPAPSEAGEQASFGWLLGVPTPNGAHIQSVQITERRYDLASPCAPATLVPQRVQELDGRWVALPGWRPQPPGEAITLTPAGQLRGQPLMRLGVQPVRRMSSRTLFVLDKARVVIGYRSAWPPRTPWGIEPGSPFATVVRARLLNGPWLVARASERPTPSPEALSAPFGAGRDQPAIAADPEALKLVVAADGPVALRGADLAAAGWPLSAVDPGRLSLRSGGRPQAMYVEAGADGRLDPDDQLLFHGRAMTGEYTVENVYWLTADGAGWRMESRRAEPDRGWPAASWHPMVAQFERDTVYYLSMHWRDGDDRWMWGRALGPGDRITRELVVGSLAAVQVSAARLHVTLQGCTDDERLSPDHRAQVWLNDRSLGQTAFEGLGRHDLIFEVPPGVVQEGPNRFALANEPVPGALLNQFYLNRIALEYAAGFRARQDRLRFRAPAAGRWEFQLAGFSRPDIVVDDITEPSRPVRLLGTEIRRNNDGFGLRFASVTDGSTQFEAYVPSEAGRPRRIVPNEPSSWRTADVGADVVIISHPTFLPELDRLVAHRRSQGLRVAVVNIHDVYDEFSDGIFDPRAIRQFLRHATAHWQPPAPAYVLLVGEANLDYRRGYDIGPPNFVPQMQVDLDAGPAGSSDTWFAMLDDDPLPDILLGRISVSNPAELRAVVDKILDYERQGQEAWRRASIWVADDEAPFEALSDELAALRNLAYPQRQFYAGRFPRDEDLTGAILAAIHEGAGLVGYAGHGNVDTWGPWPGGGRILQNRDIASLANGQRLPILVAATCMNGWVSHPSRPVALAELWLTHPSGGGIAAWASSGLEPLAAEAALLRPFVAGLGEAEHTTLGSLTLMAMAQAWAANPALADTLRQITLLGDPALRIDGPLSARATPPASADPRRCFGYLPALANP